LHLDALRKVNSQMAEIEAEDRAREAAIDVDFKDVSGD
jgi:hypothetical protein